ncbi:RiPP maturation radical SAM C-methyltransferase [Colwelliaceae bacterium 6441]
MSTDVCLISMPYSSLTTPSLALGLIETYIAKHSHKVTTIYGNIIFANKIGLMEYNLIDSSSYEYLLGEWTFSRAAFPDKETDDEGFFNLFSDITDEIKQKLLNVRIQAEQFIEDIAQDLLTKNIKIIGCTSTFQQNCASLALLRKMKQYQPNIITMMGGANCEGKMGEGISETFSWVDYVFSGECDEVIGEFVNRLLNGEHIQNHQLPFGFIGQQNQLIISDTTKSKTPRAYITDMTKVDCPTYDAYFSAIESLNLQNHISPGLMMETSRGCWWGAKQHCTFCGLNAVSMAHRVKATDVVLSQLKQLSEKYNVSKFEMADNILPADYMKTVLPALAENTDYNIFYEIKANLRKSQIETLSKAGVKWIQPGFEGLQDDFLRLLKKGTTAMQNVAALKWCRNFDVRVIWNLLCSAPFEKEEWYIEMAELVPLISHLQPPQENLIKICFPRFSPYFNSPEKFDLVLEPLKSYSYVYPFSKETINNIAYFFNRKSDKYLGIYSLNNEVTYESKVHQHLQKKIAIWNNEWQSGSAPMLHLIDKNDKIVILDTRSVATNFTHELTGLSAIIYRLCEEPIAKERLLVKLNTILANSELAQISEQVLDDILQKLINAKLILHLSKCYMALAFSGDNEAIENLEHPAGHLNIM